MNKQTNIIPSLTGIKVVALILIFYQHSLMPTLRLGLGSRMCELLFVISGFLVGYNKIKKDVPCTYKASIDYVTSKIIVFYPLHVIITLLRAILEYKSFSDFSTWLKFLLSLALLTPWSPYEDTFFAFNGSSWFLSALLFCYFLSPLFIRLIKTKHTSLLFLLTFVIRFAIDAIPVYTSLEFLVLHTHVNPFVRSLEFFMGMLLVPFYLKISLFVESLDEHKNEIFFSLLELITLIITILFMYIFLEKIPKSCFVLLFCLFVLVFAFNKGFISKIFSLEIFKNFNKVQFEFYLSHTTFLAYCAYLISKLHINTANLFIETGIFIIEFFLLWGICIFYKKVIKDKCTEIMKTIIQNIYKGLMI